MSAGRSWVVIARQRTQLARVGEPGAQRRRRATARCRDGPGSRSFGGEAPPRPSRAAGRPTAWPRRARGRPRRPSIRSPRSRRRLVSSSRLNEPARRPSPSSASRASTSPARACAAHLASHDSACSRRYGREPRPALDRGVLAGGGHGVRVVGTRGPQGEIAVAQGRWLDGRHAESRARRRVAPGTVAGGSSPVVSACARRMARALLWISAALIAWTQVGYALLLALLRAPGARPARRRPPRPRPARARASR